jgi:hypothetical protein
MDIEDDLKKMFQRAAELAPPPDVERFRQTLREYPSRVSLRGSPGVLAIIRSCALALLAVSAVIFVPVYHWNRQAEIKAQLISPVLPALVADDAGPRARAQAVAERVDPAFAAATAAQFAQLELSQAELKAAAARIVPYSERIAAGLQKLRFSRDPDERKVAIWDDLLPVLQQARKNREDFIAVAIEYRRVLPLLRVNKPEVFLDSYWGELWIFNILLDSRIGPAVEAARALAPAPATVEQIYREHEKHLANPEREQFRQAMAFYENALKTVQ